MEKLYKKMIFNIFNFILISTINNLKNIKKKTLVIFRINIQSIAAIKHICVHFIGFEMVKLPKTLKKGYPNK